MESLYLLIPISVLLVFVIGVLFWWSLRSGQFDDLEGPAYRMLMDDRDVPVPDAGDEVDAALRREDAAGDEGKSGDGAGKDERGKIDP